MSEGAGELVDIVRELGRHRDPVALCRCEELLLLAIGGRRFLRHAVGLGFDLEGCDFLIDRIDHVAEFRCTAGRHAFRAGGCGCADRLRCRRRRVHKRPRGGRILIELAEELARLRRRQSQILRHLPRPSDIRLERIKSEARRQRRRTRADRGQERIELTE
jgi:hypothetical protein